MFENKRLGANGYHYGDLAVFEMVGVLLLRIVMQQAVRSVFYVFPELRIRVHVDDMKLSQREISCELPERSRNLYEMVKSTNGKSASQIIAH